MLVVFPELISNVSRDLTVKLVFDVFCSRLMNMPPVVDTAVSSTIVRAHPEGKSLVLAVLLQDTVLDLHYDSVFDACPICSCNGNIRAKVGVSSYNTRLIYFFSSVSLSHKNARDAHQFELIFK